MSGEWGGVLHSANTDMIDGSIFQSIFWFSIPLLIGNFFQQLYNTVDSYVVGNFVNTNALAAVGASTPVINMLVGFFMGLSTGAGVVISQYFGARQGEAMSRAVHSAMALTGLLSIVFTGLGLLYTGPLLRAIGVPEDVLPHSSLYLMIYFCGITFSLLQYGLRHTARGGGLQASTALSGSGQYREYHPGFHLCVRVSHGHCRRGHCHHHGPGSELIHGHAQADAYP